MRDYFGEYLASVGARPAARRFGQTETPSTPLKVHLVWGLLLAGGCFAAWKASKIHSKLSEAVKTYKKIGSRKND